MSERMQAPWMLELLDRVQRVATNPSSSEQRIAADVVGAIANAIGNAPGLAASMDRATLALNFAELHHGETVLLDVADVRAILRAAHAEMMRQHKQAKDTPR